MCYCLYHIHTFSNTEAFGRVYQKIFSEPEYGERYPIGEIYEIIGLYLPDRNSLPFENLKKLYEDGEILCYKYLIDGWESFINCFDILKDRDVFGRIEIQIH